MDHELFKTIKSLSALKRFLAIGQRWDCIQPGTGYNPGIRELAHKNSVGIGFKTSKGTISHIDYPKASDLTFINDHDNQFRFRIDVPEAPKLALIYTLVESDTYTS